MVKKSSLQWELQKFTFKTLKTPRFLIDFQNFAKAYKMTAKVLGLVKKIEKLKNEEMQPAAEKIIFITEHPL